jgi:PPIC-type PPIASE domain
MSTPLPTSPTLHAAAARRGVTLPQWLREPLLHFALLGALVFAVDRHVVERSDDPNNIVVAASVTAEAKRLFRDARGRDPSADELRALTERWVDNEVLYREGLAMRVDQGDTMIRDRVIFKSLMVVQTGLKLPPVDDKTLRDWFETQRAKYDEPARYDFQEAVMPPDTNEAGLRVFAQALNSGTPGDAQAGLRVFKSRPHANLVQSYGPEFAKLFEQSPVGEWRVLPTREGLRVMRLDAVTPPQPAVFEALRNVVLPDWTDATMAQLRTDAVRARAKKYKVRYEDITP